MITITRQYCDWAEMKIKDRRKGSMWLCTACGHRGKGKNPPKCPCKPIEITTGE